MAAKDERTTLLRELVDAIKLIKVYCWEKSFAQLIDDVRK